MVRRQFTKEADEQTDQKTNDKETRPRGDHGEKGRHPPGLRIAVFHNKRGVVLQPGITRYGTSRTTETPGNHVLSVTTLIHPCRTPGLDRFLQSLKWN